MILGFQFKMYHTINDLIPKFYISQTKALGENIGIAKHTLVIVCQSELHNCPKQSTGIKLAEICDTSDQSN